MTEPTINLPRRRDDIQVRRNNLIADLKRQLKRQVVDTRLLAMKWAVS